MTHMEWTVVEIQDLRYNLLDIYIIRKFSDPVKQRQTFQKINLLFHVSSVSVYLCDIN